MARKKKQKLTTREKKLREVRFFTAIILAALTVMVIAIGLTEIEVKPVVKEVSL